MKTERICLVTAGLVLGLVASGCRERNPAYIQKAAVADAAVGADTSPDTVDIAPPRADTAPPPADNRRGDEVPQVIDVAPDRPPVVVDTATVEEVAPPDTRDAPRDTRDGRNDLAPDLIGDVVVPPDVVRDVPQLPDVGLPEVTPIDTSLDLPISLDVVDVVEVAIDGASLCREQDTRACSSPGNPLLGACHAGSQTCTGGAWGACLSEVLPATVELCNGIDDNCNGMVDEGCASDCVVVAPSGDDATADGTAANPFATIEAAMTLASAQDGGPPKRVCVAGGATCSDVNTYALDAPLAMVSGGRVQGNYALAGAELSYCSSTQPPTTTLQFVASEQGVVFDHNVTLPSELSGFVIERYSPTSGSVAAGPISAVSVSGAGVTLSGIFVTDAPTADTTYGVDVESGGQATITGSAIAGGQGRTAAIGVYVNGGSVNLRNNCDDAVRGFCNSSCGNGGPVLGFRGRTGAAASTGGADSSAVYVTALSPAKSSIVTSSLCGGAGNAADNVKGANLATLRCESGACAQIAGNSITAGSGRQAIAVNLLGGASLLDGNLIVAGCGADASTGVVLDDAPARLQNNRIVGGSCSAGSSAVFQGVHILLGASTGEPDLHSNAIEPMGAAGDCQSMGVVVERSAGDAAARGILRNNIISAGNCRTGISIDEPSESAARVVENNDLYPGPATTTTDTSVLYRRNNTDAVTVDQVNALVGAAKNIAADPKFVSYPGDLHLSSSSPCLDRGTSEGAPVTDGDGNPRPSGAGFDIGAYESPGP